MDAAPKFPDPRQSHDVLMPQLRAYRDALDAWQAPQIAYDAAKRRERVWSLWVMARAGSE